MRLADLQFLLSSEGQKFLDQLAGEPITAESHLRVASQLREQVSQEQAHALLETTLLRQRAASKFSRASEMYFTRDGLEQASAEVISSYRAERFKALEIERVADLGCGIGGDAISLSKIAGIIGVEWDLLRLAMAQENIRVYETPFRFNPLQSDLIELEPLKVEALFCDPGRRDEHGKRIYSVEKYKPPLSFLDSWREQVPNQCIKISPGVRYDELPGDAEVEFISVKGEVREGVLWRGELRTSANRRATLLPGAHTMTSDCPSVSSLSEISGYLVEPDGAVIRAHLVEHLAQTIKAAKIDVDIAYLTANRAIDSPFARFYPVEDVFPFQLKRLRSYLRQRNVGRLTIKKRGSPLDIEMLQRRLKLSGDQHRIIFLTKARGQPVVVMAGDPVGDKIGEPAGNL
jgi:hypothetical protein